MSARAGVVVDHTMDPGVIGRIEALKASIPTRTLDGLVANASALTPAAVLARTLAAWTASARAAVGLGTPAIERAERKQTTWHSKLAK